MADNKGVVLGLSIVGAFFAAAASRSSRRRVLEQRRSRALDAPQNGHAPPGGEWVPPTLVLQPQPESRPPRGGAGAYALLLLHGIASVVLLALAPAYKPPSLTEEAWKQIFGSFLILALTLHAAVVVLWRTNAATAPPVAAVPVSASAASQGRLHDVDALVGVWLKDKELSDSMDPVCDLMSIHGIIRMAIGLIKGVEIEVVLGAEGREFKFAVLSGVLWFKIRERYVLSGPEVRHRRRDMRGGGSLGKAVEAAAGGVEIDHTFGGSHPGEMHERFYCPQPDILHVDTSVTLTGKGTVAYRQVYRKKGS